MHSIKQIQLPRTMQFFELFYASIDERDKSVHKGEVSERVKTLYKKAVESNDFVVITRKSIEAFKREYIKSDNYLHKACKMPYLLDIVIKKYFGGN